MIGARARIVEGAAGEIRLAVDEREGVTKLDEEREAANLLVVRCGQQAVNTGSLYQ